MTCALVIGATGFIGRHLVRALHAQGVETTCLRPRELEPSAARASSPDESPIARASTRPCAPAWIGGPRADARRLGLWTGVLAFPLGARRRLAGVRDDFATTSALHSYLVVPYAEGDRVALSVGFYYMANATGRLAGTLLSGLVF